jgi:hypothetical protein
MALTPKLPWKVSAGISKKGFLINGPEALKMAAAAATSDPNSDLIAVTAEARDEAEDTSVLIPIALPFFCNAELVNCNRFGCVSLCGGILCTSGFVDFFGKRLVVFWFACE